MFLELFSFATKIIISLKSVLGIRKSLEARSGITKKKWLGAIIEVQYFEETENDKGGKSIRFPVFKDIRTDKDVADY